RGNWLHDLKRQPHRQPPALLEELIERLALQEFHYQIRHLAVSHSEVRNPDDVPVYYRGSDHRFLTKARPEHRIVTDQIGKNYFYRMGRFEKDVGGLIDNSHSAMAQTAFELITSVEHEISPERIPQGFPVRPTVVERIGKTGSTRGTLFH